MSVLSQGNVYDPIAAQKQKRENDSVFSRAAANMAANIELGAAREQVLEGAPGAQQSYALAKGIADVTPTKGVNDYRQVNGLGSAFEYASNIAGQMVPYMPATALAGMFGGSAAGLLSKTKMASTVGGILGGAAPSYEVMKGQNLLEQQADPVLSARTPEQQLTMARKVGALQAIPEAILPVTVGHGGIVKNLLQEGATEGLQDYISQREAMKVDPTRQLDVESLKQNIIGGMVGGGVMGGALGNHARALPASTENLDLLESVRPTLEQMDARLQRFKQSPASGVSDIPIVGAIADRASSYSVDPSGAVQKGSNVLYDVGQATKRGVKNLDNAIRYAENPQDFMTMAKKGLEWSDLARRVMDDTDGVTPQMRSDADYTDFLQRRDQRMATGLSEALTGMAQAEDLPQAVRDQAAAFTRAPMDTPEAMDKAARFIFNAAEPSRVAEVQRRLSRGWDDTQSRDDKAYNLQHMNIPKATSSKLDALISDAYGPEALNRLTTSGKLDETKRSMLSFLANNVDVWQDKTHKDYFTTLAGLRDLAGDQFSNEQFADRLVDILGTSDPKDKQALKQAWAAVQQQSSATADFRNNKYNSFMSAQLPETFDGDIANVARAIDDYHQSAPKTADQIRKSLGYVYGDQALADVVLEHYTFRNPIADEATTADFETSVMDQFRNQRDPNYSDDQGSDTLGDGLDLDKSQQDSRNLTEWGVKGLERGGKGEFWPFHVEQDKKQLGEALFKSTMSDIEARQAEGGLDGSQSKPGEARLLGDLIESRQTNPEEAFGQYGLAITDHIKKLTDYRNSRAREDIGSLRTRISELQTQEKTAPKEQQGKIIAEKKSKQATLARLLAQIAEGKSDQEYFNRAEEIAGYDNQIMELSKALRSPDENARKAALNKYAVVEQADDRDYTRDDALATLKPPKKPDARKNPEAAAEYDKRLITLHFKDGRKMDIDTTRIGQETDMKGGYDLDGAKRREQAFVDGLGRILARDDVDNMELHHEDIMLANPKGNPLYLKGGIAMIKNRKNKNTGEWEKIAVRSEIKASKKRIAIMGGIPHVPRTDLKNWNKRQRNIINAKVPLPEALNRTRIDDIQDIADTFDVYDKPPVNMDLNESYIRHAKSDPIETAATVADYGVGSETGVQKTEREQRYEHAKVYQDLAQMWKDRKEFLSDLVAGGSFGSVAGTPAATISKAERQAKFDTMSELIDDQIIRLEKEARYLIDKDDKRIYDKDVMFGERVDRGGDTYPAIRKKAIEEGTAAATKPVPHRPEQAALERVMAKHEYDVGEALKKLWATADQTTEADANKLLKHAQKSLRAVDTQLKNVQKKLVKATLASRNPGTTDINALKLEKDRLRYAKVGLEHAITYATEKVPQLDPRLNKPFLASAGLSSSIDTALAMGVKTTPHGQTRYDLLGQEAVNAAWAFINAPVRNPAITWTMDKSLEQYTKDAATMKQALTAIAKGAPARQALLDAAGNADAAEALRIPLMARIRDIGDRLEFEPTEGASWGAKVRKLRERGMSRYLDDTQIKAYQNKLTLPKHMVQMRRTLRPAYDDLVVGTFDGMAVSPPKKQTVTKEAKEASFKRLTQFYDTMQLAVKTKNEVLYKETKPMYDRQKALYSRIKDLPLEGVETTQTEAKPTKAGVLNVWYGTGENAALSNLATAPFIYDGVKYKSVEHAYQTLKSGEYDASTYAMYTGTVGQKIVGSRRPKTAGGYNLKLMANLIDASFEQNPTRAKALLATGDARITHSQDTGIWKTEFPKALMATREKLRNLNTVVRQEPMLYDMPVADTTYAKNTTTLQAILDGKRTSTTRGKWISGGIPKVGERIIFSDKSGKTALVEVTSVEAVPAKPSQSWIDQWVKSEGWTAEAAKRRGSFKGTQVKFKLVTDQQHTITQEEINDEDLLNTVFDRYTGKDGVVVDSNNQQYVAHDTAYLRRMRKELANDKEVVSEIDDVLAVLEKHPTSPKSVTKEKTITRSMLRANPDTLFVFGDNFKRIGMGGQAAAMRGEPNAVGIATKLDPGTDLTSYLTDSHFDQFVKEVDSKILRLKAHIDAGGRVVTPTDGIGTGRAKLGEKAPKIAKYLAEQLAALETYAALPGKQATKPAATPTLTVKESSKQGYRARTIENAKAGHVTVAFAADYNTAGERLTTQSAGTNYVRYNGDAKAFVTDTVEMLRATKGTVLNIAGNGMYTWAKHGKSQEGINKAMFGYLRNVKAAYPALKGVVTGGQTGSDIAGAIAAKALGLQVTVNMPKGFIQRGADNRDYSNTAAGVTKQITDGVAKLNATQTVKPAEQGTPITPTSANAKQMQNLRDYWTDAKIAAITDAKSPQATKALEALRSLYRQGEMKTQALELGAKIKARMELLEGAPEKQAPPERSNMDRMTAAQNMWTTEKLKEVMSPDDPLYGEAKLAAISMGTLIHDPATADAAKRLRDKINRRLARVRKMQPTTQFNRQERRARAAVEAKITKKLDEALNLNPANMTQGEAQAVHDLLRDLSSNELTPVQEEKVARILDRVNRRIDQLGAGKDGATKVETQKEVEDAFEDDANNPSKMTKKEREAKRDLIHQMRGKEVTVKFLNAIGAYSSFTYNPQTGARMIRLAAASQNVMSEAYHESMHDLMHVLNNTSPEAKRLYHDLRRAASTARTMNRLRELLKDHPDALRQIENSKDERVAYMFQFYAMGELKLKKDDGLITTILNAIQRVLGLIPLDERAFLTMDMLLQGNLASESKVHEALSTNGSLSYAEKQLATLTKPLRWVGDRLFTISIDQLHNLGFEAFDDIADLFWHPPEREGIAHGFGYLHNVARDHAIFANRFSQLLENTTEETRAAALATFQAMKTPTTKLEKDIANLLEQMHQYLTTSGVGNAQYNKKTGGFDTVPIGKVKNYFHRVWDIAPEQAEEFVQLLQKYGNIQPEEGYTIVKAIQSGNGMMGFAESEHHIGFTPAMAAVRTRQFTFINESNAAEFAKFQSQDLVHVMGTYIRQASHRGAYTRTFGNMGEVLHAKLSEAKQQGATEEDIARAKKIIMGLEGTLGWDMNPYQRAIQNFMITAMNLALLPLALLSSLVDPMGIAIRTGNLQDAWDAFREGVSGILEDTGIIKPDEKDAWKRELTTTLGILQDQNTMEAMGYTHSSQFMGPGLSKANDTFFKLNGMASWDRHMRRAAAVIGMRYLMDNKDNDAVMRELQLEKGDVVPVGDIIAVRPEEFGDDPQATDRAIRIQDALFKFVSSTILRPHAGLRPTWMSDPRFALLAHLKQFTFSFQNVILRRVTTMADRGDYLPAGILAAYVPLQLAIDLSRGMVNGSFWVNPDLTTSMVGRAFVNSGVLGIGSFATSAAKDIEYGNIAGMSFLGPTADGLSKVGSALFGDGSGSRALLHWLPGGAALKGWI